MENFTQNENSVSSKGGSKPYERKIKINQINQKKYPEEEDEDKKEDEKIIDNKEEIHIENQGGHEIEIQQCISGNEKGGFIQDNQIKKSGNIQNKNQLGEYLQEEDNQNEELALGMERNNIREKKYFQSELNNGEYMPDIQDNIQIGEYDDQFQYGDENDDNEQEKEYENKYNNYKYKYKKIKTTENNIEREEEQDNEQNEEGEENEEEDQKEEEADNFDYQEIKKKPGRILHQSTQETFDEEGNRIVTTKTIKEFKQTTGGVRIRNIQNEKEKIEYERYTTNNAKNNKKLVNTRKTHSTYKSDNAGDRVYLLAQLAKLKNDAEKNKVKRSQIHSDQSPIIIHESDGYENQNSIFSNELAENNSFDEEMYERNYRSQYGKMNNNYILNNQEYGERYFYPSQHMRYTGSNGMMQEEYFGENDSFNNRKDIPSPIGYIATYSSGSEDNEEIGKSYEQIRYRKTNSKNKIDKNKFKKEGELIKKSEIIYQLEDPNEYIGFNEKRKNKRLQNLSNSVIKAQIDTSKSDKRDFQSPDRGGGVGSERFRKVTMAMISSLGPTCEDRKITRKMRSEVGGVVDLRQELNPINTYKIKKFQRYGNNLNKEINPKTKLEGAKIIQYWWRKLKNKKIIRIKYIKIVKIQSVIRRYLIRKRITTTKITYYILETLDNIVNNHYKKEMLKLFKYSNEDKAKKKLIYITKTLNEKNNKQKILKYFYKYKFITDFLKNIINNQTTSSDSQIVNRTKPILSSDNKKDIQEEYKETEITEEMYIKYIKEKYLNNNKSQHISELSIDKKKKEPYEIENKTKYEIPKTKKELIDEETQDEYVKKETKDIGTQNEKEKMFITNESAISCLNEKHELDEKGIGGSPKCNEIEKKESISIINKQTTVKEIPKNEIIKQDKISIIYNKPLTKEEGIEGGSININEISEKNSLLFPKIKKEMAEASTEAKPEQIIKLDSKTEISIIKPKKELIESGTQKEIEENKINNLNQISFLYQKPKTTEQGTGIFSLGEGIDKVNINFLKEKKEYKDSETEPLKQNMELTKNDLSIIKPIKQLVEADSQYRDPNLPTDKNKEIYKLVNKKIIKEKLYLGSGLNRWRKIALGEKIKNEIDEQRLEKLKQTLEINKSFLKKYLQTKFKEFVYVCKMPEKKIELIKYDSFNITDTRPENKKVQLDGFIIEKKEKPALQIDKKEEYNILKIEKHYKDEETQEIPDLIENGVNPDVVENQIVKNELINFINKKRETTEEGTNPKKMENEISNIPSINYTSIPKELIDTETYMENAPQEICNNEPLNIIRPKKEYNEISVQYIDPSKRTSVTEVLNIIITKKINRNNLNLGKYLTKWYKITKEDIINDNANKIIKHTKGYIVRKKIKNNENKNNGSKKLLDIYEQLMIKQFKKKWNQFVEVCKMEEKKLEQNQNEYFSIIDIRPENREEKINDIFLKPKEKAPLEINNLEKLDISGKVKNMQDFGTQNIPEIIEEGTQNEIPKNEINNNNQLSFLHSKKEMIDGFSQNETFKPEITNDNLNIICKIEKQDEGQQIGSWKNTINKNDSINIISDKPKEEKKIVPNSIKKTESLEIIKNKKELCDQEIQYIPQENIIETQEIEIKRNKPETKENSSQYIPKNQIICKSNSYSILIDKKKYLNNKYIIDKNTITILQNKKELIEQGEQYDMPREYKAKEIIIGNNIRRGNTQKIIGILEKIWIKKEKTKFITNCKTTAKETMIKRELLRMALLRWRFIKGYGGDRYGIIYDRNGNEIGKKEGLVNDVSIQNNLDEEINNERLRSKQLKIKISKQNPIYIKSNIIHKPKIMNDMGTGDEPNHLIHSKVDKITTLSYKKKPKPPNRISKNSFKITKIDKKLKSQGTYMPTQINKIVQGNQILFIKDNKLRNIINRRRDLLIQIISKSIIREKYTLNDYFSKWYTKTMKIIQFENNKKIFEKVEPRISKNEKFEIIQKTIKRDKSYSNTFKRNKIVHNSKIEIKNMIKKKDVGILIDFPNTFKAEKLKTRKINNDMYKSYKKPIILRQIKGDSTSIFGRRKSDELGTPVGKEVEDEINIRITEIFVKFFKTRTSPKCILRKYLSIWHRNAQYMPLMENAKIITTFCRSKLKTILVRKNWRKLYTKFLFSAKQYNIMKILKKLKKRRYKLIRLIRMTRLITIFNKRKFLHYIIMYWLIYTISTVKKRNQIKMLYENMLTTYVSMADDIFGKNKKNNPSIQDCMFEIIDTDKYQIKELEDVPIAKIYYSKKNEEKKIITNIKYIEKEIGEEKDYTTFKEISKKYYSPKRNNDKEKDEEDEKEIKTVKKRGFSIKRVYNINKDKSDNKNISTNNIDNNQRGSKYSKGNNSYKGNRTETNIDTNILNENINTQGRKYGKTNYSYKGYNKTDISDDTNNKDIDNIQGRKFGKTQYSSKWYNKTDTSDKNINNENINSQGETKYGRYNYSYKGNKSDSNIINNKDQDQRKFPKVNYTYKPYNNTEININNDTDNSQKATRYGRTNYSYKGYNKTDINDKDKDKDINKSQMATTIYGRTNYSYKGYNKSDNNNNNNINKDTNTSQGGTKYGKGSYTFKSYNKIESNNNNRININNNRYSDINTDVNNIDNQQKGSSYKGRYYNNKSNNIEEKEQKKDEKIKIEYKNYYNSQYSKYNNNNTGNENNRISKISNEEINNNNKSVNISTKVKPEEKTFYRRYFVNRSNNDEKK